MLGLEDFTIRLLVAIACGALIGAERQWINRIAGIQTNMLVSTGACVFILSSFFLMYEGQAASRIAAQIVSGVGFLGAGMIFKDGFTAHGLNTAATIWCSAAIGVLAGMGFIDYAAVGTIILMVANFLFRKLDHFISKHRKKFDLRIMHNYELDILIPKEVFTEELKKNILKTLYDTEDATIYSVKTKLNPNVVKLDVSFKTHNLSYDWIHDIVRKIESASKGIIADWSQVKNN